METNRGCPYTCTFCAQGVSSHNRLNFFSLERVKDEACYIASKVKNTNILNFADSNFGIADRDIEITKYLAAIREEAGYPRKFNTNWAKNQPKLFEFSKILTNFYLVVSLQSVNETVLKNIKRSNISQAVFKDIISRVNTGGGVSGVELIVGLPGETKESHLDAIRQLFDWDVSFIVCYNLVILEGTQMSMDKQAQRLEGIVKYRLIDHSFGKYDDITSFEVEEGMRSTPFMPEEDMLFFRPIHWLVQFLWNFRFYFDLLKYIQHLKVNPVDYLVRLMDDFDKAGTPVKVRDLLNEFKTEAKEEWFDSAQSARNYYSDSERFRLLKEGLAGGKMNFKYIFRFLLEAKEPFEQYLYDTAVNFSPVFNSKKTIFKDILNFSSASIIDFTRPLDEICKTRSISCKYDILAWKVSGYKKSPDEFYMPEGVVYDFYLPAEQELSLRTLLKQYENKNINVTLRKMTEYMDIADLIYKVKYDKLSKSTKGAQYAHI